MRNKILLNIIPKGIILFTIIAITYYSLHRSFWNDELFSFEYFATQGFKTIIKEYPVPNNHIGANLLYGALFIILDIDNASKAIDFVIWIRLFGILIAIIALVLLYNHGRRYLSFYWTNYLIIISVVCIPFLSFGLDSRGYALSSLLLVWLLFLYDKVIPFRQWILVIPAFFMMITVPSNMLLLLSLCLALGIVSTIQLIKKSIDLHFFFLSFIPILSIGVGIGVAIIYFHYFKLNVFNNKYTNNYVELSLLFKGKFIVNFFLGIFLSKVFLIILLNLFFKKRNLQSFINYPPIIIVLAMTPLIAIIINLFMGINGPVRILSPLILPLNLAFVILLAKHFHYIEKSIYKNVALLMPCLIFMVEICLYSLHSKHNIEKNIRTQDFYRQYYLLHYNPSFIAKDLSNMKHRMIDSVFLYQCERYDIAFYLKNKNISYRFIENIDSLISISPNPIIITPKPNDENLKKYSVTKIIKRLDYYSVVSIEKKQ